MTVMAPLVSPIVTGQAGREIAGGLTALAGMPVKGKQSQGKEGLPAVVLLALAGCLLEIGRHEACHPAWSLLGGASSRLVVVHAVELRRPQSALRYQDL
jgi:hypothetical protein